MLMILFLRPLQLRTQQFWTEIFQRCQDLDPSMRDEGIAGSGCLSHVMLTVADK